MRDVFVLKEINLFECVKKRTVLYTKLSLYTEFGEGSDQKDLSYATLSYK